ncbi:MAG: hypothetical protein ACLGI8_05890 [Acidimicrobiia bacterium]
MIRRHLYWADPEPATGSLRICGTCHRLRGPVPDHDDGAEQLCDCTPQEVRHAQPLWGGDHNTYAELCRCCGLRLLSSGSRFSVWFCDYCKPLVVTLNRQLGRYLVPIGRHSIMSGVAVRPAEVGFTAAAELLADITHEMIAGIGNIKDWARTVVARNLEVLGFEPDTDVYLGKYLWTVRKADLHPAPAVVALMLHVLANRKEAA